LTPLHLTFYFKRTCFRSLIGLLLIAASSLGLVSFAHAQAVPGTGTGLAATYYNNQNFTGATVSRIDQTVNFDFGAGSPDPAIGPDTFSARWTGFVEPQFSEAYTFFVTADDGVRLWVDNQLIVDQWQDQAATEFSGTLTLQANRKYEIRLEYYENQVGAVIKLAWSSASTPKAIIPKTQLYVANKNITTFSGGFLNDGAATVDAGIYGPNALARDAATKDVYFTEEHEFTVRKMDGTTGVVTTVAGNGIYGYSGDGGPATSASLSDPQGIVFDPIGYLVIADTFNHRLRKVDLGTGIITTIAGTGNAGFTGENVPATKADLNSPRGIAIDKNSDLYLADSGNHVIRKLTKQADGTYIINTVAGNGVAGVPGENVTALGTSLNTPSDVAVDSSLQLYITDQGNGAVRFCNKDTFGNYLIRTWGKNLNNPHGLTIDSSSPINVYVADTDNHRIAKIDNKANVTTFAGIPGISGFDGDGAGATAAHLARPYDVVFYSIPLGGLGFATGVYFTDHDNGRLRNVPVAGGGGPGNISTLAGGRSGDKGPASQGSLYHPTYMMVTKGGSLLVSSNFAHSVKGITSTGVFDAFAGNGTSGNVLGGEAINSQLWNPNGLAQDSLGNIYIADTTNAQIMKVDSNGNISQFLFGYNAEGLAIDSKDNVYFSVPDLHRVFVAVPDPGGVNPPSVSVYAGTTDFAFTPDGQVATATDFKSPQGLAIDGQDNLYIADSNTQRVRKVDGVTKIVSTVAGSSTVDNGFGVLIGGFSGDGGAATAALLSHPTNIALDSAGNLFIADTFNQRVRWVNTAGVIHTVAGMGDYNFSGDFGLATEATLRNPSGVAVDSLGNLYISDTDNERVRKVVNVLQNPPSTPGAVPNTGSGLFATYYNGINFDTAALTRVDPTVDFDWGTGSPDPTVNADNFSVRWTGLVRAEFTETYTFYTLTDDGVQLWVNGQPLISKWVDQAPTEWSGSIALKAGSRYDIRLEYYEKGGGATAHLFWSSPSTPKQIIPQRQLIADQMYVTPANSGVLTTGSLRFKASPSVPVTFSVPAGQGTIDATGLYRPPAATQDLVVTVTATATDGSNRTGNTTVKVWAPLSITENSVKLNQGASHTFAVTPATVPVTWSATAGSIGAGTGAFTAPTPITQDTVVTVTATATDGSGRVATANVTVWAPLAIAGAPVKLNQGTTHAFAVTPATVPVTWSAAKGSFNGSTYTAPSGITDDLTDTVTATATDGSGRKAQANVTVWAPLVVDKTPVSLFVGQSHTFSATPASVPVAWSAPVGSFTGAVYTAPAVIAADSLIPVTAQAQDGSNRKDSVNIQLYAPLQIQATSTNLKAGESAQLTVSPAVGVTWSLDRALGTLTAGGMYTAPDPIPSETTVTVTAQEQTGPKRKATLTMRLLTLFQVVPSVGALKGGQQIQFRLSQLVDVTWSILPIVGGIDPTTGLYAAPAAIPTDTSLTVTATTLDGRKAFATLQLYHDTKITTVLVDPHAPWGILVDNEASILVSDTNPAVCLEKDGQCTDVAGTHVAGYSGDGGPAKQAQLKLPKGIAKDLLGNLFIADSGNKRIRRVDPVGFISTFAGGGAAPDGLGDGGLALSATLTNPEGVAVDSAGNVYIADSDAHRIRRVSPGPTGIITTYAGTGTPGYNGDNIPATLAQLNQPRSVTITSLGDLVIGDYANHRVRKILSNGKIYTIAGSGTPGSSGDGGPASQAQVDTPIGVAADSAGTVYISEYEVSRVRMIKSLPDHPEAEPTITTIAGNGESGYTGDNGPSTDATLSHPIGLALDANGNLLVVDSGNNAVREIDGIGPSGVLAGQPLSSNPTTLLRGDVNLDNKVNVQDAILALRSTVGLTVLSPLQQLLANMNGDVNGFGDAMIDVRDIVLILLKAVGLLP
jgi:surface antigen